MSAAHEHASAAGAPSVAAPSDGAADAAPAPNAVGAARCAQLGCENHGALKCGKCLQARYCSRECQTKDWKARHKAACGRDAGMAQLDPGHFLSAMASGQTSSWYLGLKRKRVYERLWMSFQMRVEDEYVFNGDMVGAYNVACGGGSKATTRAEFCRYVGLAKSKGLMPPDWRSSDDRELLKGAEDNIHFAIEKSDIVEKFGYSSMEHVVLRSMAKQIIGPFGAWV